VVRLDTNVIPAPLYLHGVHIDLVDRADLFKRGPDGLVAMDRESLPALVPLHIASRSIDWNSLAVESKLFLRVSNGSATSVIPQSIDQQRLQRLAEEWSGGSVEGWEPIQAILNHLQQDYELDHDWRPSSASVTGIEEFLFESRRGPDYQFATAAAILLRSLGYQTRVVSGFYADPAKYDTESRHTAVLAEDVHFWTEVRVSGGDWITVEPSPGYAVLGPPPGLLQQLWNAACAACMFCVRHWLMLGLITLSALVLWRNRANLHDCLYTASWNFHLWWSPEQAIPGTLRLLRARAKLASQAPGRSVTHHQWLGELLAASADSGHGKLLYELRREIDAAAYSRAPDSSSLGTLDLCRQVGRRYTLNWFRRRHTALLSAPARLSPQIRQLVLSPHSHTPHPVGK
jgi:hypothetical protein